MTYTGINNVKYKWKQKVGEVGDCYRALINMALCSTR